MVQDLKLEWAMEHLEGAFEVLALCLSLVEVGDPMEKRNMVRTAQSGTFSLLIELIIADVEGEKSKLKIRPHRSTDSVQAVTLEMINYPFYYCGARTLRIEPQLLQYLRDLATSGKTGERVTVQLLLVKERGAIALPYMYGAW